MSRANSSKRRWAPGVLVLGGLVALGGCAHTPSAANPSPSPAPLDSRVGYVRMDELVKVHPLYSQLSRLDDDLAALQLKSLGGNIARSGADVAREEKALQHELDVAAAQTRAALAGKEQEYRQREQAAIAAALGEGAGSGAGSPSIANGVASTARSQAAAVEAAANANLSTYRKTLIAQDQSAVQSLRASLGARAMREYNAAAARYQKAEADYALQLASEDASDRLSLRTKLSNLALDDTTRADVQSQLAALDKKETDAVGAMKNRDQTQLFQLQATLHGQAESELTAQVGDLRKRTVAKIDARTQDTRSALVGQLGNLGIGGAAVPGGVSPEMKAKLLALHAKYQRDFNDDANKTIARFKKTRADLTKRFEVLEGVDTDAQNGANKEMDSLARQRGDLYNEMVAQIGREVKELARQRGINFVSSDPMAPAGGVDLTADAEKDIESLHE